MIDLESLDLIYRKFINTQETFMGSRILEANVAGSPLISPFEQARRKEGLFEEDEFNKFVKEQMGDIQNTNVFGDKTQDTTKPAKPTQDIDKNDDVIEVQDQETGRVTIVKKIVVEKQVAINPIGESSAYLVIVGVILISAAVIAGIVCLVRRCNKKGVHTIAETVQAQRQKEQDFDIITEGQYVPNKANNMDLLGVAQVAQTTEATSPRSAREPTASPRNAQLTGRGLI